MIPVNAAFDINGKRTLCGTLYVPRGIRTKQLEQLFRTEIFRQYGIVVKYFYMFYPGEVIKTTSGWTVK